MSEAASIETWVWWTGGAILCLLVMSAFFSGSETALTAASRAKLHAAADKGDKAAKRAMTLTDDSERLIGAILLGNNLVNILAASLATAMFTALFGESGVALATLVMTLLVLVFAEVTPKTYAISAPERAARLVSRPISVIVRLLSPIVAAVTWIVAGVLSIFGVRADNSAAMEAQEEIAGAISLHHSEGAVEKDDRDRLLAALELKSREVTEVMMHRSNIETIDADLPPAEVISRCLASPYTRIPVWRENPEEIVGVIHAKDLLRAVDKLAGKDLAEFDVMEVAMAPWFVPDTTSLDDQMREFLKRRSHFALVVDEYGALQGLITLEDILEEIVGDIADEHDVEVEGLTRLPDGRIEVDGSMTIRDLNRAMDWDLPDDEANTVAGLVIHEAQSIPTVGQIFSFHGCRFEVTGRKRNQITKLKIRRLVA